MSGLLLAETSIHWYLPPLIVAVSLVYSATRFETWPMILRHAARWAMYIVTFLGGTYLFIWLLSLELPGFWYIPIVGTALALLFFSGRRPDKGKEKPVPSKS